MASELELRWLKVNELKGAAKHFALFCKDDIEKQAGQKDFDLTVYQDAIKLVLSKLDRSLTLENLSRRIAEDAEHSDSGADNNSVDNKDNNNTDDVTTDIHTQGERIAGEVSNAD